MRKLTLLFSLLFFIVIGASAQAKKAVQTVTIQTPTVHCEQCKLRIESDLKRTIGIQKVVVDFKRKTTKVTFVSDRVNIEEIKTAIANNGYDADDVKADPEAVKRLPKTCQPKS